MRQRTIDTFRFELLTGFIASLPAVTEGQIRRLRALQSADPAKTEPPMDASERRAAMVDVLFEGATCTDAAGEVIPNRLFLDMLRAQDQHDIINGMYAHHYGISVRYAVDLQAATRGLLLELQKKKAQT